MMGLLTFGVLVALGLICAGPSSAQQWIHARDFQGITTHRSPLKLNLSQSRSSVGWLYRGGMLRRETFDQQSTTVIAGTQAFIVGQSRSDTSLLYVTQNLFRLVDGVETDIVFATASGNNDSVITYDGDSSIASFEFIDGQDTSLWLFYTLTDRGLISIDGVDRGVFHFYSNKWLKSQTVTDQDNDIDTFVTTVSLLFDASMSIGSVEYRNQDGDTTLLLDGTYIWHYTQGEVLDAITQVFTPPTYLDSGRIDSVVEHGDTVNFWGDFGIDPTGTWILWDDTSRVLDARAHPCSVLAFIGGGTALEHATVAADTSVFDGDTTTHCEGGVDHCHLGMQYVLYQPGERVSRAQGSVFLFDSIITIGWIENLFYQHVYMNDLLSVFVPEISSENEKLTDANVWELANARHSSPAFPQTYITPGTVSISGAPLTVTAQFLAFLPDSFDLADKGGSGLPNGLSIFSRPLLLWSTSESTPVTGPYRFSVIHRTRAWYAGDTANPMTFAWSELNQYDSITGNAETLGGNDPVTGLSSLGQQLVIYRRRSIQYNLGFSEADFYKVPAPVGVGAANEHVIARNPRNNTDYIINELGLWAYDGSGVQPLVTNVREIFSDSINWDAESALRAAIWDDRYWLAAPFGSDTVNSRLIVFDLETGDVGFIGAFNIASLWVFQRETGEEQLYLGCADSSVIWLAAGTDEVYELADWRSGWWDGGERQIRKRVTQYAVDYESTSGDSLFVAFYVDGINTAVWTDTIISATTGISSLNAGVSPLVQGHSLSFGLLSPHETLTVVDAAIRAVSMGKERPR